MADCFVDVREVAAPAQDLATTDPERMRGLAALWHGDFLEGLEIDRSPVFAGWLTAQRRRFRACHTALLEQLAVGASDADAQPYLEQWLELAPFDRRAHQRLLGVLARSGRIREGEEHLEAAVRSFEAEGLDGAPLRAGGAPPETVSAAPRQRPLLVLPTRRQPGMPMPPWRPAALDRGDALCRPLLRAGARGGIADALVHDVITRLAKLRGMFVIAQGTVFALRRAQRRVRRKRAACSIVDYVVSGSVRRQGNRLMVTAELAETRTARIVWAETFDYRLDDTFLVLDEIGNRIVASVASEIETSERNRAVLRPPNSLDAWDAHHRGLWHMYRFNKLDNEQARHFFELAVRLDPTFARAHAGLSFTHWQSAFQGWEQREAAIDRAFEAAGQSVMADDRDPAAHWAMGRALWLRGHQDQSLAELKQAVDLSPNFARATTLLAFVHSTGGDPLPRSHRPTSRGCSARSIRCCSACSARAPWRSCGSAGSRRPPTGPSRPRPVRMPMRTSLAIAVCALALADRLDDAREHLATIRRQLPYYRIDDLITAMQFPPEVAEQFRAAVLRL